MSLLQITTTILLRLRHAREAAGITVDELERRLLFGPGWIEGIESGQIVPGLDTLLALAAAVGLSLKELFADVELGPTHTFQREIYAVQDGENTLVHFRYQSHDAVYELANATVDEFDAVVRVMRNELARLVSDTSESEAIKTNAVTLTFLRAVSTWPHANPSDLWWFLVYRAYCDPFNHPAQFARLSHDQSWRRTAGWALEEVLVRHYARYLEEHGIEILLANGERAADLIKRIQVAERLEADKIDVILVGNGDTPFGVIHVKASFAERRTDDVPLSQSLMRAGYVSPLWTMDCKSSPGARPVNRGELGKVGTSARKSAKRKDFEDDGYFSACFSYNANTCPTPPEQEVAARIVVCDFSNPRDDFSSFVIEAWQRFSKSRKNQKA